MEANIRYTDTKNAWVVFHTTKEKVGRMPTSSTLVDGTGFEPVASSMSTKRSATELTVPAIGS